MAATTCTQTSYSTTVDIASGATQVWVDYVFDEHLAAHTVARSEEHTSELQSLVNLVCRLLLEKKKKQRREEEKKRREEERKNTQGHLSSA